MEAKSDTSKRARQETPDMDESPDDTLVKRPRRERGVTYSGPVQFIDDLLGIVPRHLVLMDGAQSSCTTLLVYDSPPASFVDPGCCCGRLSVPGTVIPHVKIEGGHTVCVSVGQGSHVRFRTQASQDWKMHIERTMIETYERVNHRIVEALKVRAMQKS